VNKRETRNENLVRKNRRGESVSTVGSKGEPEKKREKGGQKPPEKR